MSFGVRSLGFRVRALQFEDSRFRIEGKVQGWAFELKVEVLAFRAVGLGFKVKYSSFGLASWNCVETCSRPELFVVRLSGACFRWFAFHRTCPPSFGT